MSSRSRSEKTVVVRLKGGVGNQMFCYAAARSLSIDGGATLVLDVESGFKYDDEYRRKFALGPLGIELRTATSWQSYTSPAGRVRRLIDRKRLSDLGAPHVYFVEDPRSFDQRWDELASSDLVYLDGYFQSPKYFQAHADILREDFRTPFQLEQTEVGQKIRLAQAEGKVATAIGVRLYEEAAIGSHRVDTPAFYSQGLELLEGASESREIFVFSADADGAAGMLQMQDETVHLVQPERSEQGALSDMALMSMCDQFVVSHSSYYWWAAWLCDRPNKQVVASRLFRNADIHPATWRTVDVMS